MTRDNVALTYGNCAEPTTEAEGRSSGGRFAGAEYEIDFKRSAGNREARATVIIARPPPKNFVLRDAGVSRASSLDALDSEVIADSRARARAIVTVNARGTVSSARRGARLFIDNCKCKGARRPANAEDRVNGARITAVLHGNALAPFYVNQRVQEGVPRPRSLSLLVYRGFLEQFRAFSLSLFLFLLI